ncbi:FKBP-type peptidyl-prolyl cis-trans isomerase [Pseudochryseolinea flava]|uniref:Peptidyl-prolyl cis-trans isomerase n=1 Tax=Pseudochryseolinea flava TaxID=2059302 RepID=A0A364Y007_9BACT|nr:FKBP-type peptidyl-prolyl cis-trans isomerase [Pseudochryseolinea flava]RAW00112.1 FKBP-type peptidyl-prolyl cis-trans isomerase [Pseudochryseolinea flava]
MKIVFSMLMLFVVASVGAQSKKELAAQVASLKTEIEQLKKPKEAELTDKHKKASYGLGVLIAENLKPQGGDSLDIETLNIAIKDVFQSKTLKMTQEESMTIVQEYMRGQAEKRNAKLAEAGKVYLETNKTKAGVQVTATGLQYQVLQSGKGKKPGPNDQVTVHYTGKLIDGKVFDSSVERNEPATFGVSQVIPGWTEALQLMKEGDKFLLTIPSELGYGERGAGQDIPPFSVLVFEVELIKVN